MIIRLFGLSWSISTRNPTCGEAVAAEVLTRCSQYIQHPLFLVMWYRFNGRLDESRCATCAAGHIVHFDLIFYPCLHLTISAR